MKLLPLLLLIFLVACKPEEETSHKTLIFTFTDGGSDAIASTEIEPETNVVVATHTAWDAVDLTVDHSTGKVYLAGGGWSEIILYENKDISKGKKLHDADNIVSGVAIDPAHNRIYWMVQIWGYVYRGELNPTGGSVSKLFGGKQGTPRSTGLAVDPARNRLFILDREHKSILSGDVNSPDAPVALVTNATFPMTDPHHLEISEDGSTLYWIDRSKINTTDTNTGATATLIETSANALFLHYPSNSLYIAGSKSIFKIPLGSVPVLEEVCQTDVVVSHFVVLE